MPPDSLTFLALAIFCVAFLYSCVGHAGASGYIAVMSLFSLAPPEIKTTALALNILVASIASWQFWRAGHFSWTLFWPFALLAIPMAYFGGTLDLPIRVFRLFIGIILLFSAVRFFCIPSKDERTESPSRPLAISLGAGLGLLSGMTGTGGGVFLTPILLFMRWATTKNAAAVSALFILVNSSAGLLGNLTSDRHFPPFVITLGVAAALGGTAGSYCGSLKFNTAIIKRLLATVLLIAGLKLLFT